VATSPLLVADSQLYNEAKVLKVDLRVGASGQADLSNLERKSIASLIASQIVKSLKHLDSLKDRVEDTSSKVLVTGDLNAGKSTFCNALLRRRVLPEDQQPCTSLFCEVLDVSLNNDVEEVHAVKNNVKYNKADASSYDVFGVDDLERLVDEPDLYSSVKVYVNDSRKDATLLRNGVVDIALIDAPGLNMDSLQTTAVFARQEQIDVVVFVVSAENHFTLSAKEFLWNAANEKAYLFIVVNRFDNIKDKERCRAQVLRQIAKLSPATHQDAADLVHFVSCQSIADDPESPHLLDFDHLESSLRSFVLEKRARSKLAPVKNYLGNVLDDVNTIALSNKTYAADEIKQAKEKLAQIQPEYELQVKTKARIGDQVERAIEDNCTDVIQTTRKALNSFIEELDSAPLVDYPGLFHFWQFAEDTKRVMCENLDAEVIKCESFTRAKAVSGVDMIRNVGLHSLPSSAPFSKNFHPEHMFRSKKHGIERKLNVDVGVGDFFDLETQDLGAVVLSSATACTVLGSQFLPIKSWIDGALSFTQLVGSRGTRNWVLLPLALSVGGGIIWYVVSDIPRAVPRRIAKKVRKELERVDYVNHNADRITRELRTVLGVPEQYLREQFHKDIQERAKAKEECIATAQTATSAHNFFNQLEEEVMVLRGTVMGYELEPKVLDAGGS
jgi:mitofusin 2